MYFYYSYSHSGLKVRLCSYPDWIISALSDQCISVQCLSWFTQSCLPKLENQSSHYPQSKSGSSLFGDEFFGMVIKVLKLLPKLIHPTPNFSHCPPAESMHYLPCSRNKPWALGYGSGVPFNWNALLLPSHQLKSYPNI